MSSLFRNIFAQYSLVCSYFNHLRPPSINQAYLTVLWTFGHYTLRAGLLILSSISSYFYVPISLGSLLTFLSRLKGFSHQRVMGFFPLFQEISKFFL